MRETFYWNKQRSKKTYGFVRIWLLFEKLRYAYFPQSTSFDNVLDELFLEREFKDRRSMGIRGLVGVLVCVLWSRHDSFDRFVRSAAKREESSTGEPSNRH